MPQLEALTGGPGSVLGNDRTKHHKDSHAAVLENLFNMEEPDV